MQKFHLDLSYGSTHDSLSLWLHDISEGYLLTTIQKSVHKAWKMTLNLCRRSMELILLVQLCLPILCAQHLCTYHLIWSEKSNQNKQMVYSLLSIIHGLEKKKKTSLQKISNVDHKSTTRRRNINPLILVKHLESSDVIL